MNLYQIWTTDARLYYAWAESDLGARVAFSGTKINPPAKIEMILPVDRQSWKRIVMAGDL